MDITRRSALLGLGAALASCAGGGGGSRKGGSSGEVGEIIKISYFRGYPDPRSKKLVATYRAVMSESWRDRIGENLKEPLARAASGSIYVGFLTDAEMARYVAKLRELGLDQLEESDPKQYQAQEMRRRALDEQQSSYTRVITLATDTWEKSYAYADHHVEASKDRIPVFTRCEAFVARLCEYSIQVRTMTDPLVPGEK